MRYGARHSEGEDSRPNSVEKELSSDSGTVWSVSIPKGPVASLSSSRRPRASVRAVAGAGGSLFVPVEVARALVAQCSQGEVPSTLEAMTELVGRLSTSCAANRLTAMVDKRDYSAHEATDRLVKRGYPRAVVDDVVARAKAGRLIDDDRFTEGYVRGKLAAGWGRRRIEQGLSQRGIDPSAVPGWPEDYFDEDSEFDRAWALVSRRAVPTKDPYGKTVRFLAAKGYSYGVAKACASRLLDEPDD